MIKITRPLITETSTRAYSSPRLRMNHNFHTDIADPMQRLLNAMEPGTYIRPHRHTQPAKTELIILLQGRVLMLEFDDHGQVTDLELDSFLDFLLGDG